MTIELHKCRGQEWWIYTFTPPYNFLEWWLINFKYRNNFNYLLISYCICTLLLKRNCCPGRWTQQAEKLNRSPQSYVNGNVLHPVPQIHVNSGRRIFMLIPVLFQIAIWELLVYLENFFIVCCIIISFLIVLSNHLLNDPSQWNGEVIKQ
jgi:hypothetical protein